MLWGAAVAIALADRRVERCLHVGGECKVAPASVTLVVPARNEAANIGGWVAAALLQTHPKLRIIVADDSSDDETADRAKAAARGDQRLSVLRCPPPPPGWIGKTWAAFCAARDADTDWLLFSDADMRMRPETISSAVEAARAYGADGLSLTATLECGSWSERAVMPLVAAIIFTANPICLIQDERFPTALMAGGFILVRREAYERVGGHAAVRDSIAEDRDLGERFKAFGFRVVLLNGSDFVRVRMYRGSAQMWEGWRKNFFEGVRRVPAGAAVAVLALTAMLVVPLPLLAGLGALRLRRPLSNVKKKLALVCGAAVASTVIVRRLRDPLVGMKPDAQSLLATPLAGIFIAAVMTASAWRAISGRGQTWKGRTIR